MSSQNVFTLINPQNGNLAFKILPFDDNSHFDYLQRNNYYSLIWVTKGNGKVKADFAEHHFEENSLLAFSPYQPFMLCINEPIEGIAIHFHPDFYCIHMHQKEVSSMVFCSTISISRLMFRFRNKQNRHLKW